MNEVDWNVTLVDTGLNSMTGGRVKQCSRILVKNHLCLLMVMVLQICTNSLIDFHEDHEKMVTITAVHPAARFGELEMDGNSVKYLKKTASKTRMDKWWLFCCQPEFFEFIKGDQEILERPIRECGHKKPAHGL